MDHIKRQIVQGKAAEIAVYNILKDYTDVKPPDFEIYDVSQKGWEPDVGQFEVKSQDFKKIKDFGMSWTFDKKYVPKHPVCLTLVDKSFIKLKGIIRPENIKFEEPKLARLRDIKKILYWEPNKKNILTVKEYFQGCEVKDY